MSASMAYNYASALARAAHKRTGTAERKRASVGVLARALALAIVALFALAGCSDGAHTSDASPQALPAKASIASSSELDEQSQLVDLCLPFDGDLRISGDAAQDFDITLDDEALNDKTTTVGVAAQGSELHITLSPAPDAKGVDTPLYFACYLGKLRVTARAADGVLPHVVGVDGGAALLETPVEATIPSGMRIQQEGATPSSADLRVTQFAQIRCCTWVRIGETELFMHHHRFAQESNQTCAAALAEAINNSAGDAFKATADGDRVSITALNPSDAKPLKVSIVEGVAAGNSTL